MQAMRSRVAAKNRQASYVPSLQVVQVERKEGRMMPSFYVAARTLAISRVATAVRRGHLISLTKSEVACVDCGKRARCYDHRDYGKPLEVVPVCISCNHKRGQGTINGIVVRARHRRRLMVRKSCVLHFSLSAPVVKFLRQEAKKEDVSLSFVVRRALRSFLAQAGKKSEAA